MCSSCACSTRRDFSAIDELSWDASPLDDSHADAHPKARQPHPVHGAVRAAAAVDRRRRVRAARRRPVHVLHGAARLPAGARGQDHVRARAGGVAVHVRLRAGRAVELRAAGVPPSAGRRLGQGRRAHRRHLHVPLPPHRLAVGQAHVGRVLGVGPAADLGADPVLPLPRPDRAALLDRGRGAGRQAHRRAEPGRHRHPARDQVLGGVEQPAPAGRA